MVVCVKISSGDVHYDTEAGDWLMGEGQPLSCTDCCPLPIVEFSVFTHLQQVATDSGDDFCTLLEKMVSDPKQGG